MTTTTPQAPATFPAGARCTLIDGGWVVSADIEGVLDDGRVVCRVTHTGNRPDGTLRIGDRLGVPSARIAAWTC